MHRLIMWVVSGVFCVAFIAGCGEPVIEPLDGASPNPSNPGGNPPLQAAFDSDVQPIFNTAAATCNDALCHDTDVPAVGLIIHVNPDATQLQENYDAMSCFPFTTSYSPPGNKLLTKFCVDDVSNNADHNGNTAVDADCAAIFNWVATGSGDPGDFFCN